MTSTINHFCVFGFILLVGCGNASQEQETANANIENTTRPVSTTTQQSGITGEWEQQYTCFDKNGNNKLDPDEKKPSGTRLGFNWFRFNADGSSLRDKDVKFEGTYEIQEKNGTKTLVIRGGDNLRYIIHELTDKELILGSEGVFIIFKRIE
jgi:hypothetical protein